MFGLARPCGPVSSIPVLDRTNLFPDLVRDRLEGVARKLTNEGVAHAAIRPHEARDVAAVFAGMFVLSAFVILIDLGVTLVERRLLVWRPTAAEGRG